ncbi:MAG: putative monooxygenase, partial [Xanthobacteraceae bacterium]
GEASESLIDSYSPERRGATLDVFANAAKSTRFMTPPTRGFALVREAALSLALSEDFAKGFANPRQMQPYTYAASPLTPFPGRDAGFSAGPVSGAAMRNVRLGRGFLTDHMGDGFTLLAFTDGAWPSGLDAPVAAMARRHPRLQVLAVGLLAEAFGAVRPLADPSGGVAAAYGAVPGTVYLIRPDLHVAGRWKQAAADELLATLDAGLGRPS